MKAKALFFLSFFIFTSSFLLAEETRFLREPDISATKVVFAYAGDLWTSPVSGGTATRLTAFQGVESNPHFSPDGKLVAFSGEYDGNIDVYVISVNGGEPKRLTWHPGADLARGWTPDGKSVIFASNRLSVPDKGEFSFWRINLNKKMPVQYPIPRTYKGKLSPDGKQMVYQKVFHWDKEWRNYRGGQNNPIRIIDLVTLTVQKLPWNGANDQQPVWLGNKIYFLSDRDFAMNVWCYNLDTKKLTQVTYFKEFDCKNLESGAGKLIFENGGYLYTLNPKDNKPNKLSITVQGDFPWARTHWEKVEKNIREFAISPTGKRAIFEARGEIFTVPAKKGNVRNLTTSSGAADRSPAWSPDGKYVSWFSDESGEYQLIITNQFGQHKRTIPLKNPTFYYTPVWSPDSKYISFSDANRNLWLVHIATGKRSLIDNEGFTFPQRTIYPEWSPDSKWIAYSRRLKNQYNAIFVYSLDQNKSFQITDGMAESTSPAWDADGKYLYFLASTDYGLNVGWLDLSSLERPIRSTIYLVVLSSDEPSPLLPESDDENVTDQKKKDKKQSDKSNKKKKEEKPKVKIDFKNINQRIISLKIPLGEYSHLRQGKAGVLFYLEKQPTGENYKLHRYNLKDRKDETLLNDIKNYVVSYDGEKLLYRNKNNKFAIVAATGKIKQGEGIIKTADMQMKLNPQKEWRQIFREAWRFQRDYFYVRNVHGLDLDWAYKTYGSWVKYVRHRADLNYILDILGGETSVGHSFVGGGDFPKVERIPIGLLGADFKIENGRFRIVKIYSGENWNPKLRAPLSSPGVKIKEGDYLLAVNGHDLTGDMNLYSLFDETAGKQTILTVNDKPTLTGAHDVTVVPVKDELPLRQRAWIENNRRLVDRLSGGKLAYVWLPNTSVDGYKSFNRYYFAQKDKQGAVVDERFNHGGFIADYIVDLLSRDLMGYFNNPIGNRQPFTAPNAAIWGPKVMVINEMAGSGGDMLPYMFKRKNIGPLVGKRTWGGLVGIWDVPGLIDGGYITAPRGGFYNTEGKWDVENKGVAPDVEIEQQPRLVEEGHDPQLEEAVKVCLKLLRTKGIKLLPQPPDPIRVKRPSN